MFIYPTVPTVHSTVIHVTSDKTTLYFFYIAFVFYIWLRLPVNTSVGLILCESITYLSKRQQQQVE